MRKGGGNWRQGMVDSWEYRGPHATLWNILEDDGRLNEGDPDIQLRRNESREGERNFRVEIENRVLFRDSEISIENSEFS